MTERSEGLRRPSALASPLALNLSSLHPWGPLAKRGARVRVVYSRQFLLANNGSKRTIDLTIDPLQREDDGSGADAELSLFEGSKDLFQDSSVARVDLGTGERKSLRLCAKGKLPPGSYISRLRVIADDEADSCVIPLKLRIAAHWLWAVAFMILGLMSLGLTSFLAGAADVRTKLAETLELRQSIHEFIDRHPPAEADRAAVADMEEKLLETMEALSGPRPWQIKDLRISLADRHLPQVRERFRQLRASLERKQVGEVEVEDLVREWESLLERSKSIEGQLAAQVESLGPGVWSSLLQQYLRAKHRLSLDPPLKFIEEGLAPQVERVRLAMASGEGARAQALAVRVRRSLRRAARLLEHRTRLILGWHSYAREMLVRQAGLAARQLNPRMEPGERREMAQRLSTAYNALKKGFSLIGFRDAYFGIQRAELRLTKIRSQDLLEDVGDAIALANAETSLSEIDRALSNLKPDPTPESKKQGIFKILTLWEKRVESCRDENLKTALLERIEDLERLNGEGDLAALGPGFKELLDRWTEYGMFEVDLARQRVMEPYCRKLSSELRNQLADGREQLALLEPHHSLSGVDEELDRARLRLEQVSKEDCLTDLLAASKQLLDAGNQIFTTFLRIETLSPADRLAVAEHSEVAAAVDLARKLMTEPWPLRIVIRPGSEELYVGRQVTLELENLNPSWGPGMELAVDFGDDSPSIRRSAEQVRQGEPLSHRYQRPKRFSIRVTASETAQDEPQQPVEILGEGQAVVDIRPSPISAARVLSGHLVNLRFLIALLIGLLVQGGRFMGERPFGSRTRDYVKAFALGLGVDFGLRGVTDVFGAIGLPG